MGFPQHSACIPATLKPPQPAPNHTQTQLSTFSATPRKPRPKPTQNNPKQCLLGDYKEGPSQPREEVTSSFNKTVKAHTYTPELQATWHGHSWRCSRLEIHYKQTEFSIKKGENIQRSYLPILKALKRRCSYVPLFWAAWEKGLHCHLPSAFPCAQQLHIRS